MVGVHTLPARLETDIVKTYLSEQTIADLLIVLKALPEAERKVVEALDGEEFNVDRKALSLANMPGPKYTIRIKETGEPLVVAGLVQVGAITWRTWFYANQRAWDEFGREVTVHTAKTRKELFKGVEHGRIETVTLASHRPEVFEWYEACGMQYESTMHGYGVNGESAVMYVSTTGARNY